MKKILIIGLIISFVFAGCKKKEEVNNIQDIPVDSIEDTAVAFPSYNSDIIEQEFTIEKISSAIFKDFNTEWVYGKMEDFLTALKISGNYQIEEQVTDNIYQTQEGNITNYIIKSDKYNLIVRNFSSIPGKYYLDSIEIEIDKHNYSHLFPYRTMNEYINDKGFGFIMMTDENKGIISYAMRYGDDEYLGYADLIFSGKILSSICLRLFWP